ncbi:uncharacterized protein N7487_006269 [Penicillium crustosum]|uniref:uncharacterized protein n=1 Tax=Penicillium crustosum TaxID=36656 RepID=UPI00238CDCEA|nr:uncharacterized protein N7487_006269 [Penicillium crustosum]KAJ5411910.1 hypothetical protein N7487_006269 [Penicillium crustosum]
MAKISAPGGSARRRKQIRLAQRAHRQREKEALSRHEVRIAQLETSIQKMNMAFSSFSEQLEKSGALAPHATLQAHLRDTLTTYKSLAEEVGITTDYECLHRSSQSMVAVPVQEENVRSTPDSWLLSELDRLLTPPMAPISIQNPPAPLGPSSPLLFNTTMTTMSLPTVEMSVFIRQLRVACAHYALFSLRDSSVDLEGLRSKFRFLLSIISRENLISYFEAGVVARVHPERMLEWEELPFFRVGGAGTHFVNSPSLRYENRHPVRDDPLSSFPPEVQGEMDGRWYDIRDLEGFLQEQGVRLFTSLPTESGRIPSNVAAVNVSTLIKGKIP